MYINDLVNTVSVVNAFERPPTQPKLKEIAQKFEATFIAEILKNSGLGETPTHFGGGAGEDQFGSFLRLEYANQVTKAGGIGLAQAFYDQMKDWSVE